MRKFSLSRPASRLLYGLLAIIFILLVLHLLGQLVFQFNQAPSAFTVDLIDRFNVDKELSVQTWLASFLATLTALAAFLNGILSGSRRVVWWILGGLFLLISLDETAALHELSLQGLHILAGFGEGQTYFQNAWLFLIPVIIMGVLWVIWQLKKHLPPAVFSGLTVGLGVFLLGAVVVEFLSIEVDKVSLAYRFGYTTVEEGLEFLGIWIMLYTTVYYFENTYGHMLKRLFKL